MMPFSNNTYFPVKTLSQLASPSYVIGYDAGSAAYFKTLTTAFNYGVQNIGNTGTSLASLVDREIRIKKLSAAVSNSNTAANFLELKLASDTVVINYDFAKFVLDSATTTHTPVNYTSTGTTFEEHLVGIDNAIATIIADSQVYDSGWIKFPTYDAANTYEFGFPNYTNNTYNLPEYRVIGREVKLRGKLIIPLTGTANSSAMMDLSTYKSTAATFLGTNGLDWTLDTAGGYTNGNKLYSNTIFATANNKLVPDQTTFLGTLRFSRNMFLLNTSNELTSKPFDMYAKVEVYITSTGKLMFKTGPSNIPTADEIPITHFDGMSITRENTTIIKEPFPMYGDGTAFGTYFDGAASIVSSNYHYPVNFSGYLSQLGGFTVDLDGLSFTIAKTTSINDIKTDVAYLVSQL